MSVSIESVSNDELATYRVGDTERVFSVAFHPNKQFVAFGCENSAVKLWNLRTKLYVSVVPHMGNVLALRFSLDGTHLCSAASGHSQGNTLCVWDCVHDVKDDQDITLRISLSDTLLGPRRVEVLHQDDITDVAFMPARSKAGTLMVASSSLDTTVRLWHFPSSKKMSRQPLRHHRAGVNAVTFSDDGHFLVSGSQDGDIVFCRLVMPELSGDDHLQVRVKKVPKMVLEEDRDGNMVLVEVKEHIELASHTEFMMVFRFNCQEPVLDVRFFPGFDFVTLVGANIKDNGPDRQYQLAVGTGTSICLFKLHDTFLPTYEESDVVDYLIDTAEQDVRRTRFTDDSEITFPARKINFAQVTLQMRKFLGFPVRSLVCSAISNKAATAETADQTDDKSFANDSSTLMAGFLKTKTEKMILGKRLWKKYWYLVDVNQGQLLWYKNEHMAGAPKGFQRLDAIRSVRPVKPKPGSLPRPRFKIKVIGGEDLILETEHRPLMDQWMTALEDGREMLRPKAMIMCAAVGDEVRAFTIQASALQARKPTRQQMRAETIVPEVFQVAQTVIGKHDDKVITVAIPCENVQRKFVSSGVISAGEFLTASASADQSMRLFRWSLMPQAAGSDSESEDETSPDPDGRHLAPAVEGNYDFSRSKMLFTPIAGNIHKSWMKLERPLTQHQLTARTVIDYDRPLRFFDLPDEVVPEHLLRGGKNLTNLKMLRIARDREMEPSSEEECNMKDKEEEDEEDENTVMEMLSRRLLGGARLKYRATQTAIAAQAVPRDKLETMAEKLMERAVTAVVIDDEARAAEEPDPKIFGQLATFSRMAIRKEIQKRVAERDSCTAGDCTVI
jgi:hypothetical protein